MEKVLVTGGLGFIGSHTCVELQDLGYKVIVVDNLSNSELRVKDRIEKITGKRIDFIQIDLADKESVRVLFENHEIDAIIHFAASKAVGESVEKPLLYYQNNLISLLNLLEMSEEYGVKQRM